jgi:hypothetical protein
MARWPAKEVRDDGAILEVVLWELTEPVAACAHRFKYRLYFGAAGECRVAGDAAPHRPMQRLRTGQDSRTQLPVAVRAQVTRETRIMVRRHNPRVAAGRMGPGPGNLISEAMPGRSRPSSSARCRMLERKLLGLATR